ncbi:hypothetical protein ACLOJK_036735 [Asimina triloba]
MSMSYFEQEPTVELPSLVDPFHSQEVDQNSVDKFQGDMEEGDAKSTETELEGHDKGKEMNYEDFDKQKPDQNEDSSEQMLEKEVADETKTPTEVKFVHTCNVIHASISQSQSLSYGESNILSSIRQDNVI